MAEMLLIGAVAVLTFVVVLVVLLLWRPSKGGDGDRFTNARRITTGWAADAGADLPDPVPGRFAAPDPSAPLAPDGGGGTGAERAGCGWSRSFRPHRSLLFREALP